MRRHALRWTGALVLATALTGCGVPAGHGLVDVTDRFDRSAAIDDLAAMRRDPVPLERPVLVLAGYLDLGFFPSNFSRRLRGTTTTPDQVVSASFFFDLTMEACADRTLALAERVRPADHDGVLEVDIVAQSMGGLVAREAARRAAAEPERQIRVRRIFSIASPHRGAALAEIPFIDPRVQAMHPASDFLARLDADLDRPDAPELIAYGRTRDWIVAVDRTAPPDGISRVVRTPAGAFGHLASGHDARVVADILRRLRGERAPLGDGPRSAPGDG